MANHPNRKKTPYTVLIGSDVGLFSNYLQAMDFACISSFGGALIEVHDASGVVGQYRDGKPTPEFERQLSRDREECARRALTRPPSDRIPELERMLATMAYIVLRHGSAYVPLLERLERELEAVRNGPQARARRILEDYLAAGGLPIGKSGPRRT